MKTTIFFTLAIILFVFIGGCAKEDLKPSQKTDIDNLLLRTWKISSFTDGSRDLTEQFADLTITCHENGEMTIERDGHIYNCTWAWDEDDQTTCYFDIPGCEDASYLCGLNYGWDLTGYTEFSCYFSNADPHTGCSEMEEHERIMKWTEI